MKNRSFAQGTVVSVAKSKGEIETMLTKRGAKSFGSLSNENGALIVFEMKGRRIKFTLPLPNPNDPTFAKNGRGTCNETQREALCDAERRRLWRALSLVIKAKLESVDSEIESFEQAFLATIMAPDGQTIGEITIPQIDAAYKKSVSMPPLLGTGS